MKNNGLRIKRIFINNILIVVNCCKSFCSIFILKIGKYSIKTEINGGITIDIEIYVS